MMIGTSTRLSPMVPTTGGFRTTINGEMIGLYTCMKRERWIMMAILRLLSVAS